MSSNGLTRDQQVDIYYWMRLTRTLDDTAIALWKQGRGVGGMFSQRGHEAISVGSGFALAPEDVVAPMHRDLGCFLLRGLTPRRIVSNLLARATGFTRGRDANMHGAGDLSLNLIGFISHLPQSFPVALGVAMSFQYRNEPRVALTYVGEGSASAGVFHEVLNMASLYHVPFVVIIENNQYAYSTPVTQQTKVTDLVRRADGYGIPGQIVDGNDVEAVYAASKAAIERARAGGGPTLIEAKTMRMMGHAIHDGAEYVPRELLAEWEKRNPVLLYEQTLLQRGVLDQAEIDEIKHRCQVEITDAVEYAEAAPWPDPATVLDGIYAP